MITSYEVSDASARTKVVDKLRRHGYMAKADNRSGSFIVRVRHDWEDDREAIEVFVSLADPSAKRVEPT